MHAYVSCAALIGSQERENGMGGNEIVSEPHNINYALS